MGCVKSKQINEEYRVASMHNVNLSLLKTGDLIMFADNNTLGNRVTRIFTQSKWTHVGVVVHSPGLYPNHGPLLLESIRSHNDHLQDISTSTIVNSGVRLVDLDSRIRTSKSDDIAFCRLEGATQWDAECKEIDAQKVIAELSMRPFEQSIAQLVFSAIDYTPFTHNKPDLSSVFCSELVAHALQRLEVLQKNESPSEFTPADFVSKKKLARYLAQGYSYADPQPLKTTTVTRRPLG